MTRIKHLGVLGLDDDATQEDIRSAYKRLAFQWHPDKNPSSSATKKFQEISHSYEALTDPDYASDNEFEATDTGFFHFMNMFNRMFGGMSRAAPRGDGFLSHYVFNSSPEYYMSDSEMYGYDDDDISGRQKFSPPSAFRPRAGRSSFQSSLDAEALAACAEASDVFTVDPPVKSISVIEAGRDFLSLRWSVLKNVTYRVEISAPTLDWSLAYLGAQARYRIPGLAPKTVYKVRIACQQDVNCPWSPWFEVGSLKTLSPDGAVELRRRHPPIRSNLEIQEELEFKKPARAAGHGAEDVRVPGKKERRKPKKKGVAQAKASAGGSRTVPAMAAEEEDPTVREQRLSERISYELALRMRAEELEREQAQRELEEETRQIEEFDRMTRAAEAIAEKEKLQADQIARARAEEQTRRQLERAHRERVRAEQQHIEMMMAQQAEEQRLRAAYEMGLVMDMGAVHIDGPIDDMNQNKMYGRGRLCRFFAQGRCRKGHNCSFVHQLPAMFGEGMYALGPQPFAPYDWRMHHHAVALEQQHHIHAAAVAAAARDDMHMRASPPPMRLPAEQEELPIEPGALHEVEQAERLEREAREAAAALQRESEAAAAQEREVQAAAALLRQQQEFDQQQRAAASAALEQQRREEQRVALLQLQQKLAADRIAAEAVRAEQEHQQRAQFALNNNIALLQRHREMQSARVAAAFARSPTSPIEARTAVHRARTPPPPVHSLDESPASVNCPPASSLPAVGQQVPGGPFPARRVTKSKTLCRYALRGECTTINCRFSHAISNQSAESSPGAPPNARRGGYHRPAPGHWVSKSSRVQNGTNPLSTQTM